MCFRIVCGGRPANPTAPSALVLTPTGTGATNGCVSFKSGVPFYIFCKIFSVFRILFDSSLQYFVFLFSAGGASSNPCSDTYGGSAAFSDIETRSMSEYLSSISSKFYAYVAFHSYSQLLMFPYGHTRDHLENYKEEVYKNLN